MSSSELESSECESLSSNTSSLDYIIEVEPEGEADDTDLEGRDDSDFEPYADEPIADQNWIEQYEKEMKMADDQEAILKKRLEGIIAVSAWCKCGNCDTSFLVNISECYCCRELDGCVESLESDVVQDDLKEQISSEVRSTAPNKHEMCITRHPGFDAVCLQKWSLRLASGKFGTKSGQRYRQTDTEERFLRSVAYREFCRLVYGMMGRKRIPLPACAYAAIRTKFQDKNKGQDSADQLEGFQLLEDS